MAIPHCPYCNAQGLNHLAMERLPGQVGLFYCGNCGAIYGVASIQAPSPPKRAIPAQYDDLSVTELTDVLGQLTGQQSTSLMSRQIEQMFQGSTTDHSPQCSHHGPTMILLTVPFGFSRSGQQFWICRHYRTCQQWQIATPPPKSAPPPPPPPPPPVEAKTIRTTSPSRPQQKENNPFEIVGNADLSHKLPYDPEAIASRMRAAGLSRGGSRYLHVAIDDGPPYCPQHKTEMVKLAIPAGYKNAGREVWLCPEFASCKQWELAK